MTKKVNAKNVEKAAYANYLQKALENLKIAEKALVDGAYNAAAVNTVHAAISGVDAYCVYGSSKRCTSPNHEDAVDLIQMTPYKDEQKAAVAKRFRSIIRIKNMAEYEERLVKPKDAEKALCEARELLDLIKDGLKANT